MDALIQSGLLTIERKSECLTLLSSFTLPVEDLYEDHLLLFETTKNGSAIGCFGLELFGACALLRSVVLFPQYHHQGLGSRMTRMAVEEARKRGVANLFLLTTDKEVFFAKMGFSPIRKDELPQAIKKTREVQELCPESAVSMRMVL